MGESFIKTFLLHIKYPYTATVISIMWIGIAIVIGSQMASSAEILLGLTAFASLIIAVMGFSSQK
ncbi:MAG: hypothetical protein LBK50_00375 [Candidatus Nomurabacteria bacterium]|jgi:hypothetical protein|nr:hypothetical protein [Candidatus Nomurabacteria bacterium]